ncbi:MAG: thiamine phosphate synthase [Pseudomonadota bacterium]
MATPDTPQIYLVTPSDFELSAFPARLDDVLDAHEVACVRLALTSRDEDKIARAADAVREVCHAVDVALVIEGHVALVEKLGLDGVHLTDGARSVRKVRKALGADPIVGAFCGTSRHDGMTAGEAGADYVSFGPLSGSTLSDEELASRELFSWWSEIIEVPVVAEGALTPDLVSELFPVTDFLAVGEEIWNTPDAAAALAELKSAITVPA